MCEDCNYFCLKNVFEGTYRYLYDVLHDIQSLVKIWMKFVL